MEALSRRGLSLAVLALALGLGPAADLCAKPVRLIMKPAKEPVPYRIRTREEVLLRAPSRKDKTSRDANVHETTSLVRQQMLPRKDGRLLVRLETTKKLLKVNGKALPGLKPSQEASFYLLDHRGVRTELTGRPSPALSMWPIFPEQAIEPGYTWATEAAATPGFPFPVKLQHRFAGLETREGVRCAILKTEGKARGRDPATGLKGNMRIEAEIAFDPAAGQVVRSESRTHLMIQHARPLADGQQITRRSVHRLVVRGGAGGD